MKNPNWILFFLCWPMLLPAADLEITNSQKPGDEPPSPEEALAQITVPEGFEVSLFAGEPDVRQPIAMVTDDRGRIWVAESYSYKHWDEEGKDRIIILEDADQDGRFDKRTVFWSGGQHVSGMNVGWGGVWVCSAPNLLFIPDRDGDDVPDGEPEVVLDGWTKEARHNFFNGLTWGIDGWLYGRHGITNPSLVGPPGTPEEERIAFDCSIWRLHPVTWKFEIVCRGTTNPWGMDWNAEGELFFTGNVNGHLWHAIPGALYPRMGNRADPNVSFDYERIPMCADHLHHAGTTADWTKTRDAVGIHGDLGGGHSHCGGMIYLGDNWPEEYRGRIFMSNTHGRRLNQNILERDGSGYVGKRAPDFFFANQPWYRGVTQLYGPDGGVYLSDWCDFGECHDNDGVHRTSGRIYKVTYGKPTNPGKINLAVESDLELARYQWEATNEWYARTGRRILQERVAAGATLDAKIVTALRRKLEPDESSTQIAIRALLTLYVVDALTEEELLGLLDHPDEHLRKWAVRLLLDKGEPSEAALAALIQQTKGEGAAIVRVYLASGLQRLPLKDRWEPAAHLASKAEDASDKNLPLMIWFGINPAMAADPGRAIAWLDDARMGQHHQFTARLVCETAATEEHLIALLDRIVQSKPYSQEIAEGMLEGLKGRKDLPTPVNWESAREALQSVEQNTVAARLGILLDRDASIAKLREAVAEHGDAESLSLLVEARAPELADLLIRALDQEHLQVAALQGLADAFSPQAATAILEGYGEFSPEAQSQAINTLVANKRYAGLLLNAMADGQIPRSALSAFQARQIQSMRDEGLRKQLVDVWGKTSASSGEKQALIKSYVNQLTEDVLADADLPAGKLHYQQRCAQCHILDGEGGNIGPELSGANRSDAFYLLENIIDPNATLPKDFHITLLTKKDGQMVTGNVAKITDYTVTLTTPTGDVVVNREDIQDEQTVAVSLMPEGLLNGMSTEQVRDLIGYLMRAEQGGAIPETGDRASAREPGR